MQQLRLKKNQDKRLLAGHVWIYSNEIDVGITPLTSIEPGDTVRIEAHSGKAIGLAYVNPHTLLCARLFTDQLDHLLNQNLIAQRLQNALNVRQQFLSQPFYRLVYGESDQLPGLVVDRYGDYLVAQISTAGMERHKDNIILALQQVLQPKGILWRNDSGARSSENLPSYVEVAAGNIPDTVEIIENATRFHLSLTTGQKTGWFFDHRDNRTRVQSYARGKRILDLFSYVGSFAIQAAAAGAREVFAVDSSAKAIEYLQHNAELNNLSDKIHTEIGDVLPILKHLQQQREQFDMVLVDPPAFMKRRKDIKPGYKGYQRLNELAMSLVAKGGMLVSSSCSLHCSPAMLMEAIMSSANALKRNVRIIGQGHQALDHPIHPAIPETNYLKTFFCLLD